MCICVCKNVKCGCGEMRVRDVGESVRELSVHVGVRERCSWGESVMGVLGVVWRGVCECG